MVKIRSIGSVKTDKNLVAYIAMDDPEYSVFVEIDDKQECCEDYGVAFAFYGRNGDFFIGARFLRWHWLPDVDREVTRRRDGEEVCRNQARIRIKTDIGDFEVIAYNEHNGYYSHKVRITAHEYKEEQDI